jgi:hypothetical protein
MSKRVRELFLRLASAKSEEEVQEIIDNDKVLCNDDNWKPFGGFRGNFSQIHNQQGNTIPALVEKPINSIDALLIKECKLRGIHPESNFAPKTITEAVEKFFAIKNGDFSEVSETTRRKIAENIQIIAEGSKESPNIVIYDNGEGQHPYDFEDTFLSLNKDNKLKIKFVQGKYNMGGTGVLPNCGTKKYQLILSRKHPKLLGGKPDLCGFTLVRLHKVKSTDQYKNSWYEYCVDEDGKILTFPASELELGLYNRKFKSGTYIKLFNYDLPRPSNITLDLWRDLNKYLYFSALPVLLYERREFKGKTPSKILLGNKIRIMIDERNQKETSFPISISFKDVKCQGEVTVFNEKVSKNEFVGKLAVVFTINGQVHAYLPNSFITSSAKLPYLNGYLLINIDCTQIPVSIREELFMSSRDRMRESTLSEILKGEIARELRDNDTLRQINDKRRDEKIFQNPKDEEFLNKVISMLLRKNEEIGKLLGLNGLIVGETKRKIRKIAGRQGPSFKPKRFPSYIRFKKIAPGNIKMIPQNGSCKLVLETDVEDEYLIRSQDKGEFKIRFVRARVRTGSNKIVSRNGDEEPFDVNVVGPSQGQIVVRIKAKEKLPVGTEIPVRMELSSPNGPHTLMATLRIDNPQEKREEKEIDTRMRYSIPEIIEVYREKKKDLDVKTWDDPDYNWNGEDICKIYPSSEEGRLVDAVAINMDADSLHNYVRKKRLTDKNIEHLKRLYKIGIYLISLILYFQLENHHEEIEEKEELLSHLMKGVGKIIIQVIVNEEIIKEIDKE